MTNTLTLTATPAISLTSLIRLGLPSVSAIKDLGGQGDVAVVPASGAAAFFMGGRVLVIADSGVFPQAVRLRLQASPVQTLTQQVISTTAGLMLASSSPLNAPIRFDIVAEPLDGSPAIHHFNKPVRLVFDLRGMPGVVGGENWWIAYQTADDDPGAWQRVGVEVHDPAGLISTVTDHFTQFSTGTEEGEWHFRWNAPVANPFSGAATFQFPIAVPPGQAAVVPNIDLAYSSRGLDGLFISNADQGVLGLGWSMSDIEITRDGVGVYCCWASGPVLTFPDNFSLAINGQSYALEPEPGADTVLSDGVRYYARNGPQLFIERRYAPSDGNLNASKLYWVVKGPQGTVTRLGYTSEAVTGQTAATMAGPGSSTHAMAAGSIINRWRVDSVTDVYGNQTRYRYGDSWTAADNYCDNGPGGTGNCTNVTSEFRRLTEIDYNFTALATVSSTAPFVWNPAGGAAQSQIKFIDPNPADSDHRITHIDLYNNTNRLFGQVGLTLGDLSFSTGGTCSNTHTQIVSSIVVSDSTGALTLPPTRLSYYKDPGEVLSHDNGTCDYAYLKDVANGYGGHTQFFYQSDNRSDGSWGLGASYVVTQTQTWDGVHSQPATTNLTYQTYCYNYSQGQFGPNPDAFDCTQRVIAAAPGTSLRPQGPLVGANQTTLTTLDYTGTPINQTVTDYFQDAARAGQAFSQRTLDPSDTLRLVNTGFETPAGDPNVAWIETDVNGLLTASYASSAVHSGRLGLKLTMAANGSAYLWQPASGYTPGRTYWVSAYVLAASSGQLCVQVDSGAGLFQAACNSTVGAWELVEGAVAVPGNATQFVLELVAKNSGIVSVDDVQANALRRRNETAYTTVAITGTTFTFANQVVASSFDGSLRQDHTTKYYYDPAVQGGAQYGHLTRQEDYDSSGQPYRRTVSSLFPNTTTGWIVNKPANANTASVTAGAANCFGGAGQYTAIDGSRGWCLVQGTWYSYDGHPAWNTPVGAKGELTAVRQWNGVVGAGSAFADTVYAYDSYGNPISESTYPNLGTASAYATGAARTTTTGYDSTFHLYPVVITDTLTHTTQMGYDLGLGKPLTVTDANSNITNYQYDSFGRLTAVYRPGDAAGDPSTAYTYSFPGGAPNPFMVEEWHKPVSFPTHSSRHFYDGLGREIQTHTAPRGRGQRRFGRGGYPGFTRVRRAGPAGLGDGAVFDDRIHQRPAAHALPGGRAGRHRRDRGGL